MKKVVLAFITLTIGSFAMADEFTFICKGQKDAIQDGSNAEEFVIKLSENEAFYGPKNRVRAERRKDFDRKHPNSKQILMTEDTKTSSDSHFHSISPFSSDIGVNLFIDKQMLKGREGVIGIGTGQPNDGESGPALLWYTVHYNCELK